MVSQNIKEDIRNKIRNISADINFSTEIALSYSSEERSANARKQARAANGRFGSGGGSGGKSKSSVSKSSAGTVKTKKQKVSSTIDEDEEKHPFRALGKAVAAELLIGHAVHKLRKSKHVKAASIQVKRALLRAKPENLKAVAENAARGAAKTLSSKEPARKVIARNIKPAIKHAARLILKTGKYTAKTALGAAPFLAKSALLIGGIAADLTMPQLIAASAVAVAIYYTYKHVKKNREHKEFKEKIKRVSQEINEDRYWQDYQKYAKRRGLSLQGV